MALLVIEDRPPIHPPLADHQTHAHLDHVQQHRLSPSTPLPEDVITLLPHLGQFVKVVKNIVLLPCEEQFLGVEHDLLDDGQL